MRAPLDAAAVKGLGEILGEHVDRLEEAADSLEFIYNLLQGGVEGPRLALVEPSG